MVNTAKHKIKVPKLELSDFDAQILTAASSKNVSCVVFTSNDGYGRTTQSHKDKNTDGSDVCYEDVLNSYLDLISGSGLRTIVVPILRGKELEYLLKTSIALCKKGSAEEDNACQKFFNKGLMVPFTVLLKNKHVSQWTLQCKLLIYEHCQRLIELCVLRLNQNNNLFLKLLALLFDPDAAFHQCNPDLPIELDEYQCEEVTYTNRVQNSATSMTCLLNFINNFGMLGGFTAMLQSLEDRTNLEIGEMYNWLKPFKLCRRYLKPSIITKYLIPVIKIVQESFSDCLTGNVKMLEFGTVRDIANTLKAVSSLCSGISGTKMLVNDFKILKLRLFGRLLQDCNFGDLFYILKELNKMVEEIPQKLRGLIVKNEDGEVSKKNAGLPAGGKAHALISEQLINCIKDNNIIEIVLNELSDKDSDVEEIKKLLQFVIKGNSFTSENLDIIWNQNILSENVQSLIISLAKDFSLEHRNHLFELFKADWSNNRRGVLLKFMQKLVNIYEYEDTWTKPILDIVWSWAHTDNVTVKIVEKAFITHLAILQRIPKDRQNVHKEYFLGKCIDNLEDPKLVLPAMKRFRSICDLYEEDSSTDKKDDSVDFRDDIIQRLEKDYMLFNLVSNNLKVYMGEVQKLVSENSKLTSTTLCCDGYGHEVQVKERIDFLQFLIKSGRHWLPFQAATTIWECLIRDAVFLWDREFGFEFFHQLVDGDQLHPSFIKNFFEANVLKLDPSICTVKGFECVKKFFEVVNQKNRGQQDDPTVFEDPDLIGMELNFKIVRGSEEQVARRAMKLMLQKQANLGVNVDELQKLLLCPVCLQRISIPVGICCRGHAVCSNCKPSLAHCPICRDNFLPNSLTILNQLLEITPVACKNRSNGCNERSQIPNMIDHEINCDYRLISCICNQEDLIFCKLDEHFKESANHVATSINLSTWNSLNMKSFWEKDKEFHIYFVDEIQTYFLFGCRICPLIGTAYFSVNCIGKSEIAMKYMFEIRIDQGQGNFVDSCYFILNGFCLPYIESATEIQNHSNAVSFELKNIFQHKKNPKDFEVDVKIKPRVVTLRKVEEF